MQEYQITANDADQRLDRYLIKCFPTIPKSHLYKWIRTGHIKRNHKRIHPEDKLTMGDTLQLYLSDDVLPLPPEKNNAFQDVPDDLDIIYEDNNILLLNKPVGLVVHCDNRQTNDTLINRVLKYLAQKNIYNPNESTTFTPALCNRLDRNTSGIVIAAKTAPALRAINAMIRGGHIHKTYLCITVGTPSPRAATLHAWHKKSTTHNTVTILDHPAPEYRKIITRYRTLDENAHHALLEVDLITGRTHQIRAHLSHIGTPILGDTKYGNNTENRRTHIPYQQLCAYAIIFDTTTDISLSGVSGHRFNAPIPSFVRREFPDTTII